jgi:hypothetical protein
VTLVFRPLLLRAAAGWIVALIILPGSPSVSDGDLWGVLSATIASKPVRHFDRPLDASFADQSDVLTLPPAVDGDRRRVVGQRLPGLVDAAADAASRQHRTDGVGRMSRAAASAILRI